MLSSDPARPPASSGQVLTLSHPAAAGMCPSSRRGAGGAGGLREGRGAAEGKKELQGRVPPAPCVRTAAGRARCGASAGAVPAVRIPVRG